jgi:uncharacterized membrane protein YccC
MATFALFGAVALGALSQIPGSAAQQTRTLLAMLPAGAVLITAGTLLSVSTWSATLGMVLFGFLVSFAGVGGPRLVGLAAGAQLLYILPCFPPYDPGSLGARLTGYAIAVLLLAGADLVLWPDKPQPSYRSKLADAADVLAATLSALADDVAGEPGAGERLAEQLARGHDAAESVRPSRQPPVLRPASASRRDRALGHAATTLRRAFGAAGDLYAEEVTDEPLGAPVAAALIHQAATTVAGTAAWLHGTGPACEAEEIAAALDEFRRARLSIEPDPLHPERLRLGSHALAIGESVKVLATAARVAGDAPIHADTTPAAAQPGQFWYAYRSTPWLWVHRFVEHLTPRSVYFQGALRLALALGVARLLAGVLDLSHGFWVLLAILTILRTSAAETRDALRPALVGTVIGAVLAGGLLVIGAQPQVYVVALPIVMLVGFAAGPLLGPGWAQALFTIVIAMVFAQVAPVDWHLAEARILDVAVGAAIGVLIGLFAWPRGGSGELHRATARYLAAGADTIRETVGVLTAAGSRGSALPVARRQGQLAEASYALYLTERHGAARVDWQATVGAGHHAVRGAEVLLRSCPSGCLVRCADALVGSATEVAGGYDAFATALPDREGPLPLPGPLQPQPWPDDLGTDLYHMVDIQVWLTGLNDDLIRICTPVAPSRPRIAVTVVPASPDLPASPDPGAPDRAAPDPPGTVRVEN